MIRIQQLKLPVTHTQEELEQKIRKTLKIGKHDLQEIELLRRSIDARKKSELKYVYQLDVKVKDENAVLRKAKNNQIVKAEKKPYVFPQNPENRLLFTGRLLSEAVRQGPFFVPMFSQSMATVRSFWSAANLQNRERKVSMRSGKPAF